MRPFVLRGPGPDPVLIRGQDRVRTGSGPGPRAPQHYDSGDNQCLREPERLRGVNVFPGLIVPPGGRGEGGGLEILSPKQQLAALCAAASSDAAPGEEGHGVDSAPV
ncbi:hypothetical protein EYF80_054644 [Liparis tanakae]|uniref:Uncharacterized protein n=1 Tax=Liparis tanakae TaxID=230148 RepID=A0A4Z2F2Q0_9TELE|nr:hypothetical protein EYF80_054644 [Liparis tanakae]